MITDGKFSVEVGRELDINARFRYVGADWHWLYADRMVKLSLTEKVRQVVDAGCRQYQQLDRSRARIYLSVPHSLDRVIFEAQNRHEPTVDVHDTTIIRLSAFGRCQIIRVERVNQ